MRKKGETFSFHLPKLLAIAVFVHNLSREMGKTQHEYLHIALAFFFTTEQGTTEQKPLRTNQPRT